MTKNDISLRAKKFLIKAKEKHGNKYDYSKVNYINAHTKIIIICKVHGEFLQFPMSHINKKYGDCKKCSDKNKGQNKVKTASNNFINTANIIHNNKYDYSKFVYHNNRTKSIIICPVHDEFLQKPADHLSGKGCLKCAQAIKGFNKRTKIDEFIHKCNTVHNNKYDYSKFIYTDNKTKSIIICKEHGEFLQSPSSHLFGSGCKICNTTSKGEKIIYNFLLDNNIIFIKEKKFDDCLSIKNTNYKLKYDFFIPKYNMCIEYDGIQHFKECYFGGHKTKLNEIKINDEIKNIYCMKNNIKLIRIPYKQLKNIYKILHQLFNINNRI